MILFTLSFVSKGLSAKLMDGLIVPTNVMSSNAEHPAKILVAVVDLLG